MTVFLCPEHQGECQGIDTRHSHGQLQHWLLLSGVHLFETHIGQPPGFVGEQEDFAAVSSRAWRVLAAIPQVLPFEQRVESWSEHAWQSLLRTSPDAKSSSRRG